MQDYATGKNVRSTPEERVRQDYEQILVENYGYPKANLDIRVRVPRGSNPGDEADIVVFDGNGRDPTANIVGIVECKRPEEQSGKAQLKSYLTATSAQWGVWTNGDEIEYYCKPAGQPAVQEGYIQDIPVYGQRMEDIGKLSKSDLRPYSRLELTLIFRRILNTLYANTNISRREKLGNETIKLIFAKFLDETTFPNRPPVFRVGYGEDPNVVKERVSKLFDEVVANLSEDGLFSKHEEITLDAKGVAWVVGQLERGSLTQTPSDVVGDAFEVFAESKFVGEKGEFFTPRGVIDLAVALVNPRPEETICDPACGSGGFLIAAMRHIWDAMDQSAKWDGLPDDQLARAKEQIASQCFFGIDKEIDLVRIAKAYMAISGDGRSNVVQENTLHEPAEFQEQAKSRFVVGRFLRQFNHIMTNPPYGSKTRILRDEARNFDLGHSWSFKDGEWLKAKPKETNPYILFVERCFDMLKDGGKMAIILPETVFHAPSTAHLRHFIAQRGTPIAIISLPHNTFKPYCNAKTCLLVLRKGHSEQSERVMLATPDEMGHNHQGRVLHRPDSDDVWNDLPTVLDELATPDSPDNDFVFTESWGTIKDSDCWMPEYHRVLQTNLEVPQGCKFVTIGELVDAGAITGHDGHGSPPSAEKGRGQYPYIRVSDIVNWELYRNPTSGVNRATFERMVSKGTEVRQGDVIFVRRGSYRIGTVAMASGRDFDALLTRELLTFRVRVNIFGLNAYYLLALLSSGVVQSQIASLVYLDTTLPTIGTRWRDLRLPVHLNSSDVDEISRAVEKAMQRKWDAQSGIQNLRQELEGLVT